MAAIAGLRHGITQLLTRSGEVIYDFDRDAPPPKRVLSEQALSSMNSMLVQIPEIGTARRAALPNIRSAGKTGTTQSYRDAWYVGFTGNYTAAVWLGNDDFTPTNNMTGGSLPAMIWQRLMVYAHQNIDLKPIPGIENPFVDEEIAAKVADGRKARSEQDSRQCRRDRAAAGAVARDKPAAARDDGASSGPRRSSRRRPSPRRCRRSEATGHLQTPRPQALFGAANAALLACHDGSPGDIPGGIPARRFMLKTAFLTLVALAIVHRRRRGERLVCAAGAGRRRRGHDRRLDRLSRHRHAGGRPLFEGAGRTRGRAVARPRGRAVLHRRSAIPAATRCGRNAATGSKAACRRPASGRSTPPTGRGA